MSPDGLSRLLEQVSHLVDEALALLPAEACVGDGFAVDAASNWLVAVFYVAFHHETLHELLQIGESSYGIT